MLLQALHGELGCSCKPQQKSDQRVARELQIQQLSTEQISFESCLWLRQHPPSRSQHILQLEVGFSIDFSMCKDWILVEN